MYKLHAPNLRALKLAASGLAITALLGACTPILNKRGYIAEPNVVASVRPGVDNRESVMSMLGSPSISGTFDQNSWYYISKNAEKVAFFDDRVLNQNILVIHFNEKGYVKTIDHIGLDQAHAVQMVKETTPTRGRELGFFEQIFGNVGRFSSAGAGTGGAGQEPGQ
jgi:outer membrane protein assembly factor BamE (lipoprotein component of BamABCDE complex)